MPISLKTLLKQVPAEVREQVDRARNEANQRLRDLIRHETRLLLTRSAGIRRKAAEEAISVPISLNPGMPAALESIEFEDDYWLALQLSKWRPVLEQLALGAAGAERMIEEFRRSGRPEPRVTQGEPAVRDVKVWANGLLAELDLKDPLRRVLAVREDVLGAYHYKVAKGPGTLPFVDETPDSRIELYWAVIGLVAPMLGVSVSSLTIVVLAHELAHAYTHLGADAKGDRWSTAGFASVDAHIAEGLAQYYAARLCRAWDDSRPSDGASAAFEALLKYQPAPYQEHKAWTLDGSPHTPEEVRLALLRIRLVQRHARAADFVQMLADARQQLAAPSAGR